MSTIADVVGQAFRVQREQAHGGKTRFGDWHRRLAAALTLPIARAMLAELGGPNVDPALAYEVAEMARSRAQEAAVTINEKSRDMLEGGAEPNETFTADRAELIGLVETSGAAGAATGLLARSRGKRLKWKSGRDACDDCKSLNGKIVEVGEDFVAKSGTRVMHNPLHPNCDCEVEEV